MGKLGNMMNSVRKKIGISIGEGYAKQGLSWDEVSSMPSSGNVRAAESMLESVKTGYDSYMSNKSQASTSNMIQSPGGSDGGLAASAVDTTPQPTLMSGIQNPVADNTMFNNMASGSGGLEGLADSRFGNRFQNNQEMQNQYGIIDGAKII